MGPLKKGYHETHQNQCEGVGCSCKHPIGEERAVFRRNEEHRQAAMFSSIYELPEKQLKRLEESWAGVFYKEFFTRVEEDLVAVLYSDEPSRPNIPVNVLMGLETLKSGFGWSDEELYDAFCYTILAQGNMQVR